MADYVKVGTVSDFQPGVIKGCFINGEEVAVVNWNDRFFAFANVCTHLGVELSSGYVEGEKFVVCGLHDSFYDMETGQHLEGPASADIPVYDVRIEGDDVLVATE